MWQPLAAENGGCLAGSDSVPQVDLASILARCAAGDALAWEAVVRQFQSRIYSISYHYVGNAEDARDLTQDIFIRIYRNIASCLDAEMFLPWVIRIARNACVDHLRRRNARPHGREVALDDAVGLHAEGKRPDEEYAAASRKNLIHRALAELSLLNREIIILKEIQGLQLNEIADMLHVPLGTIKSRSNRARIELARKVVSMDTDR